MGIASARCFNTQSKQPGFTLAELMVSIGILALISVATMFDLRASRRKDELRTAARVVSTRLHSIQSQAVTGQNFKSCMAGGSRVLCETNPSICADPTTCLAQPPYGVGMHLEKGKQSIELFADVDDKKNEWKKTDESELLDTLKFDVLGGSNVVIEDLLLGGSVASVDVSFQRQDGTMGMNGCYAPLCNGPFMLNIRLRHTQSNETRDIALNALTGRISLE